MKYLFPVLMVFALGCIQDIDLDIPEHEPRLAFTGLINDSLATFFVTKSARDNFGTFQGLTDAEIILSDEQGNQWVAAPGNTEGYYEISHDFPPEGTYSVSVKKEGLPLATASTGLPGEINIIEGTGQQAPIIDSQDVFRYFSTYFVDLKVDARPGLDYQSVLLKPILLYSDINGNTATASPSSLSLSEDFPLDFVFIEDGFLLRRKDFEMLEGKLDILFSVFTGTRPEHDLSIEMEIAVLSESYDRFLRSAVENLNSDIEILFAEPNPLFSNVEGGYGFLGAIYRDTIRLQIR